MKRWGVLVVFLYILILFVLGAPLGKILFNQDVGSVWSSYRNMIGAKEWWICLGVAMIVQAALLSVPVEINVGRPITKRSIVPLVVAASFMAAFLIVGVVFSLSEVFKTDLDSRKLLSLAAFLLIWLFWAIFFFRLTREIPGRGFVDRICGWLYKGSILELLIAVPAHIYVRQRDECCAGLQTALGIAFGIAVMLFSFGPGVYFLFVNRCRQRKKKQ